MNSPSMRKANTLASEAAARRSSDDMLSGWYMETPGNDKGRHFSTAAQATPNPCARAAGPPAAACLAAARWLFFVRFFCGDWRRTRILSGFAVYRVVYLGYNLDSWGAYPQPEEH